MKNYKKKMYETLFNVTVLMLTILCVSPISATADQASISNNTSEKYSPYIAKKLLDDTYMIREKILGETTAPVTACSMYGRGFVSVPGEKGDTPSLCWVLGGWTSCSSTCGIGTISRPAKCMNLLGDEASGCEPSLSPITSKECSNYSECDFGWLTSDWGVCQTTCGESTQSRNVGCYKNNSILVEDVLCLATEKPNSNQSCIGITGCDYDWEYGSWVETGGGCNQKKYFNRTAICKRSDEEIVANSYCKESPFISFSTTDLSSCTYSWNIGNWGGCNVECGPGGTQKRTVSCLRSDGTTASDEYCLATEAKPVTSQVCENNPACTYSITLYSTLGAKLAVGTTQIQADQNIANNVIALQHTKGGSIPSLTLSAELVDSLFVSVRSNREGSNTPVVLVRMQKNGNPYSDYQATRINGSLNCSVTHSTMNDYTNISYPNGDYVCSLMFYVD